MLHIILFLLKLIGWVLLAILGLVVLLVCVLLFTPLRYRVQADCAGDWKKANVNVHFSFFLHLISGTVIYTEEKLTWKMRIAWKKMKSETEDASEAVEDAVTEGVEEVREELTEIVEEQNEVPTEVPTEVPNEVPNEVQSVIREDVQSSEKTSETKLLEEEQKTIPVRETVEQHERTSSEKVLQAQEEKPEEEEDDIQGFPERIEYTFEKICDKINALSEKKDFVMEFLTDEVHKAAFTKVLAELKKLLQKLAFQQMHVDLHFGFEDPAVTGYVLAFLSICYPLTGEHIQIQPEFEQKVLEGDIFIKGKLCIAVFAALVWNLLWNKNVRTTIRHVRKLKK